MSSFNRRSILALLVLAGCGFAPALGTGGAARGLLGRVQAATPKDQADFDFVRRIEERLGRVSVPVYDLTYAIDTDATGVAITAEGAITRYNLTGVAKWSLIRLDGGALVTGGLVDSFTSYSATGSTVAGLAAKEDAERRLMVILADQIVLRLLATSASLLP